MVVRQRQLVQQVWLHMELPEYTCRLCNRKPSTHESSMADTIVGKNIVKLFSILSDWYPAQTKLTLEISIYSPSDAQHCFKNYLFGAHGEEDTPRPSWNDHKHFWCQGKQVALPEQEALLRIFSMLKPRIKRSLPKVHAVTKFVIKRQMRKRLGKATLSLLWNRLPRLEEVIYEPWRVWHANIQELYDLEYESLLRYYLPRDLKRLTLFQDWSAKHITALRRAAHGSAGILTVPDDRVAMALAKRSIGLEHLAAASLVEASSFFRSCSPHWIWENLRYLALTSDKLAHHDSQDDETASKMGEMLESAGRVALKMPQLREMVLWNAQGGQAGAFIYQLKHGSSFVIWRGSWTYQIPAQVLSAWEEVSKTFTTYDLIAKPAELIKTDVNSHAEWLALLQLPGPVVDPESLRQMRKEDALAR
ncbi:hypothetical protein EsDP_00002241 [Epichloe bromicola]|uniref:DUF6546 domain-containing protein n=1 Tax=Epichloe bromicola TaxID=79588 RepID=A0ABQ0CK68_9HYPO